MRKKGKNEIFRFEKLKKSKHETAKNDKKMHKTAFSLSKTEVENVWI